ncbi:MAG: DUF4402 domain-containing protein [Bacteroidota bacterium]|jgi:hypothetical protein
MLRNLGYIAIVALIALLCSQPTLAQTGLGANHDLTANAVVYLPLSISSPVNFTFGNIMVGGNPTVNPKTGVATSIISGSSVGGLQVAGSAAAKVIFTFASPITLNGPSSNTLIYVPSVTGGDVGAPTSSAVLTSGSTAVTLTGGNCQAWVGGELFKSDGTSPVPTNQATGTYSGTLNLAVDYYQ